MPPKNNPLKLNPLQLRTLVLLQELARHPEMATPVEGSGDVFISNIPRPHGDHFHIGHKSVSSRDASGLQNEAVWVALERKGLVKSGWPYAITLTKDGQAYDGSAAGPILHGSDH